MTFSYCVHFHPVGQGLFSSGVAHHDAGRFSWVYDCGTSSGKRFIDSGLEQLEGHIPRATGAPRVDLLALSHFDADHISGVVALLRKFHVSVLLLPALRRDQRLVLALQQGVPIESRRMDFFIDPVRHLTSIPGSQIDHVVMVAGSGNGDGGDAPSGVPDSPESAESIELGPFKANIEPSGHADVSTASSHTKVHRLSRFGRLQAGTAFEFVPYNDEFCWKRPIDRSLRSLIGDAADRLTRSGRTSKLAALEKIKKCYDDHYGKRSRERNLISLFLFAGPTRDKSVHVVWTRQTDNEHDNDDCRELLYHPQNAKACVLYTGDGFLDTPSRLRSLTRYLQPSRMKRIACLQVMHHGARGCWHAGVAAKLRPWISVFSSDPTRKGYEHPHAEVVRDFLPYGPIQVDRRRGFMVVSNVYPVFGE